MNNQLPEYNWKNRLYSYSSPVDKGLLKKVLDAKNKNGDQPLSFWVILSILLIFISGSLVLIDKRSTASHDTINNVPVSPGNKIPRKEDVVTGNSSTPAPSHKKFDAGNEAGKIALNKKAKDPLTPTGKEGNEFSGNLSMESASFESGSALQQTELQRASTQGYGKFWNKKQRYPKNVHS